MIGILVLALLIGGVEIRHEKDPVPECRSVKRRIAVKSEASQSAAYLELARQTLLAGGDTVRIRSDLMVSYSYPPRREWSVVGRAYKCGTEAAEEE